MKLTNLKVEEYIETDIWKSARDAAAICYQTDTTKSRKTPREFVESVLINNGHGRALEFGTVYLKLHFTKELSEKERDDMMDTIFFYDNNPYSRVNMYAEEDGSCTYYVTTNLRVIMQGGYDVDEEAYINNYDKNYLDDLKYQCEPTDFHEKRRTFTMDISRGCSDDFRTHISLSSICESTRWCNFSKGKFGSELTFIKPYWFGENKFKDFCFKTGVWIEERIYICLAKWFKLEAQQLKRVFPLGAKAELRLCGFDDAWQNFFWRRCDVHADPECTIIANAIKNLYYSEDLNDEDEGYAQ